jgi:hypothetical protein
MAFSSADNFDKLVRMSANTREITKYKQQASD